MMAKLQLPTLSAITTFPVARVIGISLLLYLITFQYCKYRYWRDPHSAFFNSDHVYDRHYSSYRESQALDFVEAANADGFDDTYQHGSSTPVICATVITVTREDKQYFNATLGSLVHNLTPEERQAMHLRVFFAQTNPESHPAWEQPWLDRLTDASETYDVTSAYFEHLKELESARNFNEKGILYAARDFMAQEKY